MVLSDRNIIRHVTHGSLGIDPFDEEQVEAASYDMRLGSGFLRLDEHETISLRSDESLSYTEIGGDRIVLRPGELVLGTTLETVSLPDRIAANVLGRSSLGRLGVSIHQTAGFIDPGFEGDITLELSNHGPAPVELQKGDRVAQIIFRRVHGVVDQPYGHDGSQYQGQKGVTESGLDFS